MSLVGIYYIIISAAINRQLTFFIPLLPSDCTAAVAAAAAGRERRRTRRAGGRAGKGRRLRLRRRRGRKIFQYANHTAEEETTAELLSAPGPGLVVYLHKYLNDF